MFFFAASVVSTIDNVTPLYFKKKRPEGTNVELWRTKMDVFLYFPISG